MGAVNFSLSPDLVQALTDALPLEVLVETGTFEGDTIAALLSRFREIHSVELSPHYFEHAKVRFANELHVHIAHGDSPSCLKGLVPALSGRGVLYYLDAHWCVARNTAGEKSQCPLLDELRAIDRLGETSVIVIDDARLFLAPPPAPHDISQWPSFDEIVTALRRLSDRHELMVVNDVVVFYPPAARDAIHGFARRNGVDWLHARQAQLENAALRASLEEKEAVIRKMKMPLHAYRLALSLPAVFSRFVSRMSPWSTLGRFTPRPRLGVLYQHEPRDLRIPRSYWSDPAPAHAPKVSLVTPSFRQAAFIERTILSVLEQHYPNLEYYVQDGGSEDGTREIIQRHAHRLAGWESRPDDGQAQAINLGFAHTSGEIMAWLNSDDILLPGALNCVANFFNSNPGVDVIYGHRLLIDENDKLIGRWILPAHNDRVLSWVDFVPQETLFWRRSLWEKAGGRIDESFDFAMDWDLLLRFRDAGARFARIPRFLGGFRIHPHQKTLVAIHEIGSKEMARLRERALGRVPTRFEVRRAVAPYLLRHVASEVAWRVRGGFGGDR
jgi:hypothetical protein